MTAAEPIRTIDITDLPSEGPARKPSDDEIEVMQLVAQGLKDQAIARRLGISVVTVRRRARAFRQSVGATNRSQAIALAAGRGWLDLKESEETGAETDTDAGEDK